MVLRGVFAGIVERRVHRGSAERGARLTVGARDPLPRAPARPRCIVGTRQDRRRD